MQEFFQRVARERHEEVFVYIHGHANFEDGDRRHGQVALHDAENRRTEVISFSELAGWVIALQADHAGIAVDTCYSGLLQRRLVSRRHLYVAMSTNARRVSFGDEGAGYHVVRTRGGRKFGDWSDLFIVNFRKRRDDDKVDVGTQSASNAVGTDSLNRSPRRFPRALGGH